MQLKSCPRKQNDLVAPPRNFKEEHPPQGVCSMRWENRKRVDGYQAGSLKAGEKEELTARRLEWNHVDICEKQSFRIRHVSPRSWVVLKVITAPWIEVKNHSLSAQCSCIEQASYIPIHYCPDKYSGCSFQAIFEGSPYRKSFYSSPTEKLQNCTLILPGWLILWKERAGKPRLILHWGFAPFLPLSAPNNTLTPVSLCCPQLSCILHHSEKIKLASTPSFSNGYSKQVWDLCGWLGVDLWISLPTVNICNSKYMQLFKTESVQY